MPSKVAAETSRRRRTRIAAMTPSERVQLAVRLGEEGVAAHMAAHGVSRQTAIKQIKATRRLGRPRSVCAESDEY